MEPESVPVAPRPAATLGARAARGRVDWSPLYRREDWWAVWLGFGIIAAATVGLVSRVPRVGRWSSNPLAALPGETLGGLAVLLMALGLYTAVAVASTGGRARTYLLGFPVVFGLATLAYLVGSQETVRHLGLSPVLWALALGLLISNTAGTPAWLGAAARTELFIKTGLVLLGAGILFDRVLALGFYGLGVTWLVVPVVFGLMYYFGTRVLRMENRGLVCTISAATSVCGVSAAIATGAAIRARKEEISYAISLSLLFTVLMMVGIPAAARAMGLGELVGGAWIGGTVDSTGAVIASGALLGRRAMEVAAVVKMVQNMLIGVMAFALAVVWVTRVEREPGAPVPSAGEVWARFPKFVLGFVAASALFSFICPPILGEPAVARVLATTEAVQGWLFALAFVSIGLESDVREMLRLGRGGKPVVLYVVGSLLDLALTLAAAWVLFSGRFFPPPL